MSDFSGKTAQRARAWNEEAPPKVLPWLPASILAGLVGGIVAPVVFLLLIRSSIVVGVEERLLRESRLASLAFFYLITGISGAVGGTAAGLIFYATRRKPLRRAARWSIVWAAIGLLGYTGFMITVDLIAQLLPSMFFPAQPLIAFLIVSATLSVLTAGGLYLIDPDGEEYG